MTALAETRPEPPAPAPHDRASPSAHGLAFVAYGHSFRAQGPAPVRCAYWIARISTDWAASAPNTALREATMVSNRLACATGPVWTRPMLQSSCHRPLL